MSLSVVIKKGEIERYLDNSHDFINEVKIENLILENKNPSRSKVKDIIQKSLSIQTLTLREVAVLLNVEDKDLLEEIFQAAGQIKRKVYDNRIVTFAPLYLSNYCINSCLYCGFRSENREIKRRRLTIEEVIKEVETLVKTGHRRLIVVYGEHPASNIDYIVETIRTIYSVKRGNGQIRRVNVNAPPMSIEELKRLKEAGIGTYQVFQETYHHETYKRVHPKGIKSDYRWRLYVMHRAFNAGIDDVGIGALFGLYNWKFEVMGLVSHAVELEEKFGVGPHTISFPRLEPALNTPFVQETEYKVKDEELKRIIAILRLSVPYTGLILTAREPAELRRQLIPLGVTQTDASTKIGIGAYSKSREEQELDEQQFLIGDSRNLEEVIGEFADMGYITSFCTAGYRCGRTGQYIMDLLKNGKERWFCKLNAVLTFREWIDDYASDEIKEKGELLIQKEIEEIKQNLPEIFPKFMEKYERIKKGERDIYF